LLAGKEGGSFEQPHDLGTGPAPRSLTVADFDNDGGDDLAVAGGGEIAIYIGADGTFARRTTLTTPSSTAVIATDLDLDGNYDLVAAGSSRAVVTVFMGAGDGTFVSGQDFATKSPPTALLSTDLNGDEFPDVVTGDNGVSTLFGNGDGTLGPRQVVSEVSGTTAITGSDFDGDGAVDLALARTPNVVDVLHNGGDGYFVSSALYRVGATPVSIGVTFVDSDSNLDLVTANRGTNDLSVLPGLDDGRFGPEERVKVGKAPVALAIEDLNADGLNDVVTANRLSESVTVLLNGVDAPQPVVCLVPGVAKRTLAVARRLVGAAQCKVASVRRKYSGRVKKGRVISITPPPGARRPVDTPVALLVSRGHKPKR
jgi:FG-GAP-like repeat/PASTA domain